MSEQQQTRKAMRKLKADRKALSYKRARDAGGGVRECARRELGGFFNLPVNRPEPLVQDAQSNVVESNA